MFIKKWNMNPANMARWTALSQSRLQSVLDLADKFMADPFKTDRLKACFCIPCFYQTRIGCAAITQQACMCCGEAQTYGSTDTDALCLACAQKNELCKHCGSDIKLRVNRRNWPVSSEQHEDYG